MNLSERTAPISVVMPVHNALPYLDEAVESILRQTWADFEFVIYDDGSTDGSYERLKEWAQQDSRIKLFRGERNLGPAASSNQVVRHATAPLIARMDADDVSYPGRLKRQAEIMAAHSDVGLVGSLCNVMNPQGRLVRGPEIWRLMRKSCLTPFPHGSMMFRRELFDAIGGYRDRCEFWEDLDFVHRTSAASRILVLPEPLYCYRQSPTSTRLASKQERVEKAIDLRYRVVDRLRQNRGYDDLLDEGPLQGDHRVDVRVFISLGLLALWSGRRQNILRRFFKRARLRLDTATFVATTWVLWTRTSPRTLRALMNVLSKLRNATVRHKPHLTEPIEWRTPDLSSTSIRQREAA
jgi:glycosyltransferase involved in cell wall biosynthesis